ncbi:hypothetical protein IQ264_05935 [Phormidium sp. LEGE 05292]|uniref:hypothetical protein n=1 Tax=[Phormidium] sp. LEGE 05292 TaxID=767427 RepID=UPI00188090F0|nr:hypothetical protein [Phormidium sp. LEGE 05292]MBE9224976.1 hypothetical protein [Phormidium sp. LEGE 05292]
MSNMQSVYKLIALEVQQRLAELNVTDFDSPLPTGASKNVKKLSRKSVQFLRNSRYFHKLSY